MEKLTSYLVTELLAVNALGMEIFMEHCWSHEVKILPCVQWRVIL